MVLTYSTPEDHPFANSKPTPPYSNMWPTCLRGQTATGHFESVSVEARGIGIEVGTQYSIRFYDFNDHYGFTIYTPRGNHHLYGKYTWSLAQSFRDSLSGGQNTRQSQLDLGIIWNGPVVGMCIATDQNEGSFSSQLGVATFNLVPTRFQ